MIRKPVFWFTGLSGSGKTTLCHRLAAELYQRHMAAHVLDGDELRATICSDLGFSLDDRRENIRRIIALANSLASSGMTTLVAAITPLNDMRREARCALAAYYEIYVSAPLEVCELRDVKGFYRKARSGQIRHFTGVESVFEEPQQADLICRTDIETVEESAEAVLRFALSRKEFSPGFGPDRKAGMPS